MKSKKKYGKDYLLTACRCVTETMVHWLRQQGLRLEIEQTEDLKLNGLKKILEFSENRQEIAQQIAYFHCSNVEVLN